MLLIRLFFFTSYCLLMLILYLTLHLLDPRLLFLRVPLLDTHILGFFGDVKECQCIITILLYLEKANDAKCYLENQFSAQELFSLFRKKWCSHFDFPVWKYIKLKAPLKLAGTMALLHLIIQFLQDLEN